MKLSKKIKTFFLSTLLASLFISFLVYFYFLKSLDSEILECAYSKSNFAVSSLENYALNIHNVNNARMDLVSNSNMLKNLENLPNHFSESTFSTYILDKSNIFSLNSEKFLSSEKELLSLGNLLKNKFLKNSSKDTFGITYFKDTYFFYSINKFINSDSYIFSLVEVSDAILSKIVNDSRISLVPIRNLDTITNLKNLHINNTTYKYCITNSLTSFYVPFNPSSDSSIGFKISYKNSKNYLKGIVFLFLTISFLSIILINVCLYSFIKKNVLKRISTLNKELKSLDINSFNTVFLKDNTHFQDDISELITGFNNLLYKVNEYNISIKYSEHRHREILNNMTNGFIYCKCILSNEGLICDGKIIDINDKAKAILKNYTPKILTLSELDSSFIKHSDEIFTPLNKVLSYDIVHTSLEIELTSNIWCSISINSIEKGYFFIILNDITKLKIYSEEMTNLATYDSLTTLYNRRKLIEHMSSLEKSFTSYVLYFIDLDNFKKLNDTLGHETGDELLKLVASDLSTLITKTTKVGRLGGDEFLIVKETPSYDYDSKILGEYILNLINKEYIFNNFRFNLKSSIGISSYPCDADNKSAILKYADIAMYNSKLSGGNTISIFDKKMLLDLDLEEKIKDAILNKEFIPFFQPIYNISEDKIDSIEALVRWKVKETLIPPFKFIPTAKRTGLIIDIDRYIFISTCIASRDFYDIYGEYLTVSVNVSYGLLMQSDFSNFIISNALKFNIPFNTIKLEITEDEIIEDIEQVIIILKKLKSKGFKIALDDFGVGYSSFGYIKKLPITTIKIDKSLISSIETDHKTASIISSLIELSKSLDLEVICEGIENSTQFELLKSLKCDKIQGFYFSKPVDKNSVFEFISKFNKK